MRTAGTFELRPRRLGEMLDLTFRVYRQRFGLFASLGIVNSVLVFGGTLGWQVLFFASFDFENPENVDLSSFAAAFLSIPLFVLLYSAIYGTVWVTVNAVAEETLLGRKTPLRELLRLSVPRVPAAVVAAIVTSLVIGVGLLFCLIPGIFFWIALSLTIPALYLERRGPFAAISRSWELVLRRGPGGLTADTNWVRVLVIGFVTIVVLYVLITIGSIPVGIAQVVAQASGDTPVNTALGPQFLPLSVLIPLQLVGAVIQGVFMSIGMIPWPLMLYDIRMRHEGLDLELRLGRLTAEGAP